MKPEDLRPPVFVDPTDDGPEVDILRQDKIIIRQGDDFVLGYLKPRVDRRYLA